MRARILRRTTYAHIRLNSNERTFESIKFTAFRKSARNPHRGLSVLMAVSLIMAMNAFIAEMHVTADKINFIIIR